MWFGRDIRLVFTDKGYKRISFLPIRLFRKIKYIFIYRIRWWEQLDRVPFLPLPFFNNHGPLDKTNAFLVHGANVITTRGIQYIYILSKKNIQTKNKIWISRSEELGDIVDERLLFWYLNNYFQNLRNPLKKWKISNKVTSSNLFKTNKIRSNNIYPFLVYISALFLLLLLRFELLFNFIKFCAWPIQSHLSSSTIFNYLFSSIKFSW